MTRDWALRYYLFVWMGAGLFFIPLVLSWIKVYKRWWIREMDRHNRTKDGRR